MNCACQSKYCELSVNVDCDCPTFCVNFGVSLLIRQNGGVGRATAGAVNVVELGSAGGAGAVNVVEVGPGDGAGDVNVVMTLGGVGLLEITGI